MIGYYPLGQHTVAESASQVSSRVVEIYLSQDGVVPAGSLSELRWVWFDQPTPDGFSSPTDKGVGEDTDVNGILHLELPNSNLNSGEVGWLVVTDSNGSPYSYHRAFSGPVTVI